MCLITTETNQWSIVYFVADLWCHVKLQFHCQVILIVINNILNKSDSFKINYISTHVIALFELQITITFCSYISSFGIKHFHKFTPSF